MTNRPSSNHLMAASTQSSETIRSQLTDKNLNSLVPAFVAQLPREVATLEACLCRGDFEQLKLVVHKLRGSGGLYGFMPITEAASSAEKLLYSNGSLEAITAQVQALLQTIRRVEGYSSNVSAN